MKGALLLILPFLMLMSASLPAQQDTVILNTVSITAPRESLFSPGFRIESIDSTTLGRFAGLSAAELLARNGGGVVRQQSPGMLALPSFRGTSGEHTAILWNGVPLNASLNNLCDLSLLPCLAFDHLSIRHGGGAALYGSSAMGGVLGFSQEMPSRQGFSPAVTVGAGSFSDLRFSSRLRWRKGRFALSLPLYLLSNKNNYPYVWMGSSGRMLNAAWQQWGLMPSLYWCSPRAGEFRLHLWMQANKRQLPDPVFSPAGRAVQNDSSFRLNLEYRKQLGQYRIQLRNAYMHDRLMYENALTHIYSDSRSTTVYNEADLRHPLGAMGLWHAGASSQFTSVQVSDFSSAVQEERAGLFGGLLLLPSRSISLSANLRKDLVANVQTPLVPSLGLEWKSSGEHHRIHTNLHRSYNLPTLNMRYWQPGGNPNLLPEKGWSAEAGWDVRLSKKGLQAEAGIGAFAMLIENWIQWLPVSGSVWSPRNIKTVFSRGLESRIRIEKSLKQWRTGLSLEQNLTLTTNYRVYEDAGSELPGRQLMYVPLMNGNLQCFANRRDWQFRLSCFWSGKRYTTADNDRQIPGWFVMDVHAERSILMKGFSLSPGIRIGNLTGASWASFPGRPMPGRSVFFSLSFSPASEMNNN